MKTLWIVHRDSAQRSQLGRLVGPRRIVAGSPGGVLFREAEAPDVVLMGLPEHPDRELAFAEETRRAHPGAGWLLVRDRRLPEEEARVLFCGLGAQLLAGPPAPKALAEALARAGRGATLASLDERASRTALEERAGRWFQGTRALEEARAPGPLWVRGEAGTGRLLLARTVHARRTGGGHFLHLPCSAETRPEELAARLTAAAREASGLSVCLEGAEQLPPELQRELRSWIQLGPPLPGLAAVPIHWWVLTADGPPQALLEPELAGSLAGGEIRLAPLRERPGAALAFARATLAAAWADSGAEPRALSEEAASRIEAGSWPGNLEELELRLRRAAGRAGGSPIGADELGPEPPAADPPEGDDPPEAPQAASGEAAPAEPLTALAHPETIRRVIQSLAHELRNPLVSIRTFAGLLPERYEDAEFRTGFREHVESDVAALEERVERLVRFSELGPQEAHPVDVSSILLGLLEEQRAAFEERRLLVLRELESDRPFALGDEEGLRFAFEAVLRSALEWAGERADLYLASRHHPSGLRGEPAMRVLVRFHGEAASLADLRSDAPDLVSRRDADLELLLAEELIRAQNGVFTVDASGDEAVILIDLPAPGE